MHLYSSTLVKVTAVVVVLAIVFFAIVRAARRFEREQRRKGRWDEHGPLHPTEGPPAMTRSYGMQERLEVIGLWPPRKLPFRRKEPRPDE